jgi:hypothetical protein
MDPLAKFSTKSKYQKEKESVQSEPSERTVKPFLLLVSELSPLPFEPNFHL